MSPEASVSSEQPPSPPHKLPTVEERIFTGHGTVYVTITFNNEGRPYEVFVSLRTADTDDNAYLEAISRLISLSLRFGVDPIQVVDQLRGITCHPMLDRDRVTLSIPDAVALAIIPYVIPSNNEQQTFLRRPREPFIAPAPECPECYSPLIYAEG